MPLLTENAWLEILCRCIDRAMQRWQFRLVAFVLMPEQMHLLVYPTKMPARIDQLLASIKQPFSVRIKRVLETVENPLLGRLTVRERPGKMSFRFWQEGPGYDRNLDTEKSTLAAIDYFHLNPVRRLLVNRATDWKWSSAAWYLSDRQTVDKDLPTIHGLPADFFVLR